jgi:hypothetical protein
LPAFGSLVAQAQQDNEIRRKGELMEERREEGIRTRAEEVECGEGRGGGVCVCVRRA